MIRQIVRSTPDPGEIHPGLAKHQAVMIERCPYLGPSVARGLTLWSAYIAEPTDRHDLLGMLARYAEQVRRDRRDHGPLVCRNIAILGPKDENDAKNLMDWPAWLTRNLYANVQIIVDRFWIGVGRDPGRGKSIMPNLPVSFFMIRCGIPNRDRLILAQRLPEEVARLRAGSGDDGQDVVAEVLGEHLPNLTVAWDRLVEMFPVPATP